MKNMKVKSLLISLPLLCALTCCTAPNSVAKSSAPKQQEESATSQEGPVASSIPEANSSNEGAQSSQNISPSGKSVTVKFWHTFGQTVVDGLKAKINAFKTAVKNHDNVDVEIDLKYQGGYDDIAKLISDGYSVMNSPTIAVAYPDNVADYIDIGKSAGQDFVVNLDKFIDSPTYGFGKESYLGDKYEEDDFIEGFYGEGSAYTVEGTYSLPFFKSTEIMFYNLDLLTDVLNTYKPELSGSESLIQTYMNNISWDDFMSLCSYANTYINAHRDVFGNSFEVPLWYDSDANYIITKMFQNRISYSSVGANGLGIIDFANEPAYSQVIELLDEARQLHQSNTMTTKGIKKTYGSDYFTNEKCLFSIGSSGGSGYNFPQADAFTLGVCPVPADNNNPVYVSQGPTLAMFNDRGLSKEENDLAQLYAWKFLKYITNGQANAELCINGSEGYVPVRYSAYETSFFLDFMDEGERYAQCYRVVDAINAEGGYFVAPAFKGSAALRDECGTMLTASLNAADKNAIKSIIDKAINDASMKMGESE